jgi:hypothetical protein
MWPAEAKLLIPGINDTWNDFQKARKGRLFTPSDWKLAREALRKEFNEHVMSGGVAEPIPEDWRRYLLVRQCM